MSKKLAVYFLLLSFLGQSMLANAFPISISSSDIRVSNKIPVSSPAPNLISESLCHEDAESKTFVNNIELSSNLELDFNVNNNLEDPVKHENCENNCHCSISLHSGFFSAILFEGFETNVFPSQSEFLANQASTAPIKIPSFLLRPPSFS
jgi:hypothetical protein